MLLGHAAARGHLRHTCPLPCPPLLRHFVRYVSFLRPPPRFLPQPSHPLRSLPGFLKTMYKMESDLMSCCSKEAESGISFVCYSNDEGEHVSHNIIFFKIPDVQTQHCISSPLSSLPSPPKARDAPCLIHTTGYPQDFVPRFRRPVS